MRVVLLMYFCEVLSGELYRQLTIRLSAAQSPNDGIGGARDPVDSICTTARDKVVSIGEGINRIRMTVERWQLA